MCGTHIIRVLLVFSLTFYVHSSIPNGNEQQFLTAYHRLTILCWWKNHLPLWMDTTEFADQCGLGCGLCWTTALSVMHSADETVYAALWLLNLHLYRSPDTRHMDANTLLTINSFRPLFPDKTFPPDTFSKTADISPTGVKKSLMLRGIPDKWSPEITRSRFFSSCKIFSPISPIFRFISMWLFFAVSICFWIDANSPVEFCRVSCVNHVHFILYLHISIL